jgi:hypothetical protein
MHLVGEVLADAQLVTGAKQCSQVEASGFEPAAKIGWQRPFERRRSCST